MTAQEQAAFIRARVLAELPSLLAAQRRPPSRKTRATLRRLASDPDVTPANLTALCKALGDDAP